eukprot:scaffold97426_cov30-Tisochrysis_lutea.AAC.1
MPIGLAGIFYGPVTENEHETDGVGASWSESAARPLVPQRFKGEVLHSGCLGFDLNLTRTPPLGVPLFATPMTAGSGAALSAAVASPETRAVGGARAASLLARTRVLELVDHINRLAAKVKAHLQGEMTGTSPATQQLLNLERTAGAAQLGSSSAGGAYPSLDGKSSPAEAPAAASLGIGGRALGLTSIDETASPTQLESRLLASLRRSDFEGAYSAWVALRQMDALGVAYAPGGREGLSRGHDVGTPSSREKTISVTSHALRSAVTLLADLAAAAFDTMAKHDAGSYGVRAHPSSATSTSPAAIITGLSVFCGSVPDTCAPIAALLSDPSASAAASTALSLGLSRSGSLVADELLRRALNEAGEVLVLVSGLSTRASAVAEMTARIDSALALAHKATAIEPSWAAPIALEARVHEARGDYAACITAADEALRRNPHDEPSRRVRRACKGEVERGTS